MTGAEPVRELRVSLTANGEPHERIVEARRLLVHLIRDDLGLTGTHIGCDTASCGACTVLLDGLPVKSCTILAAQADGCELRTVEGLAAPDGAPTRLQRAFSEHHALQCGYCTPGMLISATALLERSPRPDEAEIRHAIHGNICRCTGYVNIVAAIAAAAE